MIWNRLSVLMGVLLVAAGVVSAVTWYLPEIERNRALQAEHLQLERQVAEVRMRREALREQIAALTPDPRAAERLIRERYGLARPGEVVVLFEPPAVPAPVARR